MRAKHLTYMYGFALVFVATTLVIFHQMFEHGWIDREAAELLAIPYHLFLLLTIGSALDDLLERAMTQEKYGVWSIALGIGVIGFFAHLGQDIYTTKPLLGVATGAIVGIVASLNLILRYGPIVDYLDSIEEEWMGEEGAVR